MRVVIIFSSRFRMRLTVLPTGPSPLVMPRRFSMSDLFIVRVNNVAAVKTIVKKTKPMMRHIQLEKGSIITSAYVSAAAVSDETKIFSDDFQSTVSP